MPEIKSFSCHIRVFARLFQKAVLSTDSGGRAPQSAKSHIGVFFFIAFSFAPAFAKEKAGRACIFFFRLLAVLGVYIVGVGALDDPHMCIGVAETG